LEIIWENKGISEISLKMIVLSINYLSSKIANQFQKHQSEYDKCMLKNMVDHNTCSFMFFSRKTELCSEVRYHLSESYLNIYKIQNKKNLP
jgi:hypothetical protein